MNPNAITTAVDYAIKYGCVPVQFDKTCSAGGYIRRFTGSGTLCISPSEKNLTIYGVGGFITRVHICSRDEAISYITNRFHSLAIDQIKINTEMRAFA